MRTRIAATAVALVTALSFGSGSTRALDLASLQWDHRDIHVTQAWQLVPDQGAGIKVCSIDTGVSNVPDLKGAVKDGTNTTDPTSPNDWQDDNGHGTFTAGEIAGRGVLLTGVAPAATILAAKVLDSTGSGDPTMITGGILWCAMHGAQVANLSFGGKGDTYDGIKQAINFACSAGMDMAVASGNDGVTDPGLHPAAIRSPCLVSVNALDQHNRLTSFSNYGEGPRSISAPGSNIASDSLNGSLMIASGTSVASPLVAGTLALLRSEGLDAQAAVQVLLQSAAPPPARPHSNPDKSWAARYGAGILDAGHAMQLGRELLAARDTELEIEKMHQEFR